MKIVQSKEDTVNGEKEVPEIEDVLEMKRKGETDKPKLTTNAGAPVSTNQDVITAGPRGPMLMHDIWYLEKIASFDRELIPERRMHAKGGGAYGTFTVTNDITEYTRAKIFSEVGKQTEMFARFSTVFGEKGAADDERDIRGFALKFYTEEGNWDLVGNNTPVFFMRDPHHFSDLNHVIKRNPQSFLRDKKANWDYWTLLPEALHQVTITMSDRGIPYSFRHMHGFGSHAFSMINKNNERVWVKFHMITQQGIKNLTSEEAEKRIAKDRDANLRDLFESIEKGDYPSWKMYIQVMTQEEAEQMPFNPFDLTKVWYHGDFPLIEVGVFELNRNVQNYFAEVEQAAFTPANIIPGIGFSPDKMLEGRLFSYGDAQRYRLGVNHYLIPVNKARVPIHSYHRDGMMRVDDNYGPTLAYDPNSYGEWYEQPEYMRPAFPVDGEGRHWDFRQDDDDYYTQPGKLFRLLPPDEKKRLFQNTADDMKDVPEFIQLRHAINCARADPDYGRGVADAIGLNWSKIEKQI